MFFLLFFSSSFFFLLSFFFSFLFSFPLLFFFFFFYYLSLSFLINKQLFCVGLWCMDEYWYYSIFTLIMLLLFEATVVKSRMKNLRMLRDMIRPPHTVSVLFLFLFLSLSFLTYSLLSLFSTNKRYHEMGDGSIFHQKICYQGI